MKITRDDRFPLKYLIYFLLIAIIISGAGYLLYLNRKAIIEEDLSRHILAIKEIKLEQIEREQLHKKNVLESFLKLPEIKQDLVSLLSSGGTLKQFKNLVTLSEDLIQNLGFSSINIFDLRAELYFTTDSAYSIKQNFLKHELTLMLGKDSTSSTNMYVSDNKNLMQAIVVPVFYNREVKGLIWAEFSFFEFLHPIMFYSKQEPGDVEFILFKVNSDIAFLLRDFSTEENSSLLTIPLSQIDREALRSTLGAKDLVKGINFRGTKSYASVKNIAGTDWVLITKIDEKKIISSLRNTAFVIFSIALLLIIVSASITYANWKRSRLHFLSRTLSLRREKEDLSERYTSLTKYANDMIISFDKEGRILETNQKAMDLYGYSKDELLNMNFLDLSCDKLKESKLIFSSINSDEGILFETNHKRKDGSVIPVEISSKLIRQVDEEILISIIRDNTERKKLQAELILALDRAEQNDRLKTIILANMSHELNTPMSGIIGFSEILMLELQDKNHREMASLIHKSSTRLNETLTSILDLSKLEADRVNLKFDVINLMIVVEKSLRNIESVALERNIDLNLITSKDEILVEADENIIMKILNNILNNATKYIQQGSINVCVKKEKDMAVIEVRDTGIGIPKSELERIFEPFRQVSEGSARVYEGTGIGLTITKKFIELLGGSIEIHSKQNEGTLVIVKLALSR
jgi:PAS domain S-box-containing protein